MTSTPSFLPILDFQKIETESTKVAVEFIRGIFNLAWTLFRPYLPYVIGLLLLISIWSVIKALMGRWGQLGSLVYHIIFFGILALAIVIKGWEILFNPIFDILYYLFYRFSYFITGLILRPFRKRY
jgi:hypothetical protein